MARFRQTLGLWAYAIARIPLLASVRPVVEELSDHRCVVRIALGWWTRNHLGSMYFGTLAMGADCAGGLIAMEQIRQKKIPVSLVFKDFRADFLKRAEGDVRFVCEEGEAIRKQVEEVVLSDQRISRPVKISAFVASEKVADFVLTLSLKRRIS